eukprot:968951-Prorocentrum_minimum.AAC.6
MVEAIAMDENKPPEEEISTEVEKLDREELDAKGFVFSKVKGHPYCRRLLSELWLPWPPWPPWRGAKLTTFARTLVWRFWRARQLSVFDFNPSVFIRPCHLVDPEVAAEKCKHVPKVKKCDTIVQFFGTCEYAWVMGTEILKWSKGLEKKLHQKKGKTFKYGLEDILELVQADFDPTKYPEGWWCYVAPPEPTPEPTPEKPKKAPRKRKAEDADEAKPKREKKSPKE